jgi:hypothetical protein
LPLTLTLPLPAHVLLPLLPLLLLLHLLKPRCLLPLPLVPC